MRWHGTITSCIVLSIKGKGKVRYSSSWGDPHLRAMGRHLSIFWLVLKVCLLMSGLSSAKLDKTRSDETDLLFIL